MNHFDINFICLATSNDCCGSLVEWIITNDLLVECRMHWRQVLFCEAHGRARWFGSIASLLHDQSTNKPLISNASLIHLVRILLLHNFHLAQYHETHVCSTALNYALSAIDIEFKYRFYVSYHLRGISNECFRTVALSGQPKACERATTKWGCLCAILFHAFKWPR